MVDGLHVTPLMVCAYALDAISVVAITIPMVNLEHSFARLSINKPPPPPGARWEPSRAQCKHSARAIEQLNCARFHAITR